jgi:hypothetical protein
MWDWGTVQDENIASRIVLSGSGESVLPKVAKADSFSVTERLSLDDKGFGAGKTKTADVNFLDQVLNAWNHWKV